MTFDALLVQIRELLQREQRLSYRALKVRFHLDDDHLEALKDELIYAKRLAVDEEGRVLVWTGAADMAAAPLLRPASPATPDQDRAPRAYTPPHLAEKIRTARAALEGERKQVTVLFADLKGSLELILADRDPEEARQLLDPVLERMMAAVHRYEGTVNQVMGDGIMALFGAPIAHEDHAVRACYAALAMQAAVQHYAAEVQRTHGVPLQMRVGVNAGEVVVRAISNDLHMDYSAIGQTTHLAAVRTGPVPLPERRRPDGARHICCMLGCYLRAVWSPHRGSPALGASRRTECACPSSLSEPGLLAGWPSGGGQTLAERTLALAHAHQERGNEAYALRLLGEIAARRDPLESTLAEAYYRQALALADELGMRPLMAHCHGGLGMLYLKLGRGEQARPELSAAIALYRAMEMMFWLPQAEAALAQVEGP